MSLPFLGGLIMVWAMKFLVFLFFAIGFSILALFGAGTNVVVYHWAGYLFLGVSGLIAFFIRKKNTRTRTENIALISTFVLGGYLLIQTWLSPVKYLGRMDALLVLAGLVTYFIFSCVLTESKYRVAFISLVLILGTGCFLTQLYQKFYDASFLPLPGYERSGADPKRTLGGFFNLHNHAAAFFTLAILPALALGLFGKMRIGWRLGCFYFILMLCTGVGLTMSRGGIISLVFGMVVFGILAIFLSRFLFPYQFKRIFVCVGGVMCIGLLGMFWFSYQQVQDRFLIKDGRSIPVNTLIVRTFLWETALEQFQIAPIFGTGPRSYMHYSLKLWNDKLPAHHKDPVFVHNEYYQLLAEYGIVGLGLMAVFLFFHFKSGFSYLRWFVKKCLPRSNEPFSLELAIAAGSLCALLATMLHAFVEFQFHSPPNLVLIATLLAIVASPGKRSSSRQKKNSPLIFSNLAQKTGLLASTSILLVLTWLYAPAEMARASVAHLQTEASYPIAVRKIKNLEKAVQHDPYNPFLWREIGWAYRNARHHYPDIKSRIDLLIKASSAYQSAIHLYPQDSYNLLFLARVLDMLNRFPGAEQAYQKALFWSPKRSESYSSYGAHLFKRGEIARLHWRYKEALKLFQEAKEYYQKAHDLIGHGGTGTLRTTGMIEVNKAIKELEKQIQDSRDL